MAIKIRDTDMYRIIDISDTEISNALLLEIKNAINSRRSDTRIALNLLNVSAINHNFLEFLTDSDSKISLFNISLNIYLLLFIMKYDKTADLYVTEKDFIVNRRNLIKRDFKLLQAG